MAQPLPETTAHRWLKTEFEARCLSDRPPDLGDYDRRLAQLEKFLRAGRARLLSLKNPTPQRQFEALDRVLAEQGFVCYVKTQSLWQTLATEIPTKSVRVYRRAERYHPDGVERSPFDCATGSVLYLSVFESLGRPVSIVEVPGHNFVRWRIEPREHLNWEVNYGECFSDDDYRGGIMGPSFGPEAEQRCGYLKDMTADQVEGYHLSLAATLIDSQHLAEKLAWNQRAVELYPSAFSKNNLAWLVATERGLHSPDMLEAALILAREAVELRPDNNLLDTLAVVHAARGEFEQAITVELGGNSDPNRLRNYRNQFKPTDPLWNPDQE